MKSGWEEVKEINHVKKKTLKVGRKTNQVEKKHAEKKIFLKKKDKKEGLIKRPLTGRWLGLKSAGRGSGEGAAPPPSPPAREEKSGWHPRLEKRQTSLKKKTSKVEKKIQGWKKTRKVEKKTRPITFNLFPCLEQLRPS